VFALLAPDTQPASRVRFEIKIVNQRWIEALRPALKSLGLPQDGLHTFRRGCNRRWELAGMNPAVLRTQTGHTTATMTALYTGQVPLDQVKAEFSNRFGKAIMRKTVLLENLENEAAA
jgi:integrase